MFGPDALSFFTPWALIGLAVLPVVWWLIKLTPARVLHVKFPAVHLLQRIEKTETTAHATPWWLMVMRSIVVVALVIAAAHPIRNPGAGFPSEGPLLLVIDDGWAAAKDWEARRQQAGELVHQAQRQGRNVMILTTAPVKSGAPDRPVEILTPAQAIKTINSLQPKPWDTDRRRLTDAVHGDAAVSAVPAQVGQVVWLHDGIISGPRANDMDNALNALRSLGDVRLVEPSSSNSVRVLYPPMQSGVQVHIPVHRAADTGNEAVTLVAYDDAGRVIGNAVARFGEGEKQAEAVFHLPLELRNRMEAVRIDGESTAGAVLLLDERWRRRPVGLVHERSLADSQPLLNDVYYLDRALEPVSDVFTGPVRDLLNRGVSVVVLSDPGIMTPSEQEALEAWVDAGGVLVVFAGPRMAAAMRPISAASAPLSVSDLLPVELRSGDRAMGGTMSWHRPTGLAPFRDDSPFFGLSVSGDVTVRRQVLAQPGLDIEQKTWARLADGTPLVTAAARNKGWTILFHVGANAEWSSLPLSGLFVEMLQRIVDISRGLDKGHGDSVMEPLRVLDGFGALVEPWAGIGSVMAKDVPVIVPSSATPPGFYGTGGTARAVNLSATLAPPRLLGGVPSDVDRVEYNTGTSLDLLPLALMTAMALMVLDLMLTTNLIRSVLRGLCAGTVRTGGIAAIMGVCLGCAGGQALAQDTDEYDAARIVDAINNTRLAYVQSGDAAIDEVSRLGLRGLTVILAQRTAVELAEPMAVDIETDELIVFPLIYWPVTGLTSIPSIAAAERVNKFMANGGTVVFDMQQSGGGAAFEQLKTLARVLNIPRLVPVPGDHVLTRSYYLINDFPGRWTGDRVWVVPSRERVNDGVSPVIAGSHQWAGAWAMDELSQPLFAVVPGGERQRELAFRFGVNLTMYVLTGNYKDDQVHLDSILDRLN